MKSLNRFKKKLAEAGYTISESGKNILKDGKSVAGINPEGNLWSGSAKVRNILKGEVDQPTIPTTPKTTTSRRTSTTSASTGRPKARPDATERRGPPRRPRITGAKPKPAETITSRGPTTRSGRRGGGPTPGRATPAANAVSMATGKGPVSTPRTTSEARRQVTKQAQAERELPSFTKWKNAFARTEAGRKAIQQGLTGKAFEQRAAELYKREYGSFPPGFTPGMAKGGLAKKKKKK